MNKINLTNYESHTNFQTSNILIITEDILLLKISILKGTVKKVFSPLLLQKPIYAKYFSRKLEGRSDNLLRITPLSVAEYPGMRASSLSIFLVKED
jgi:hypothetical protein